MVTASVALPNATPAVTIRMVLHMHESAKASKQLFICVYFYFFRLGKSFFFFYLTNIATRVMSYKTA